MTTVLKGIILFITVYAEYFAGTFDEANLKHDSKGAASSGRDSTKDVTSGEAMVLFSRGAVELVTSLVESLPEKAAPLLSCFRFASSKVPAKYSA